MVMAEESYSVIKWLAGHGVKYKMNYHMAHEQEDGKLFFNPRQTRPGSPEGGIKAVLDLFYSLFEHRPGMEVCYGTKAVKLLMDERSRRVRGVRVEDAAGFRDIAARGGVIMACGGFEANPEMRAKYLGPNWDLVKVRGTRYNTGEGLQMCLDIGAAIGGHMSGAHANPVFARGPDVEMEDAGFAHDYPDGILVNLAGKRFVDEAPDYRRSSYAMVGREVLAQPKAIAFEIFDAKVTHRLSERYSVDSPAPPFGERAQSLEALAGKLGIDQIGLTETVRRFNAAITDTPFNPGVLDGKRTEGIDPPKSNWAQPIDTPPFLGYPVTVGITFTYGGLKIDRNARVLDSEGKVIAGLYAAGEIAGTYFHNYLGGSGLLKGMVFGRIAGRDAAEQVEASAQP
jgi:tricarballylate dehydrogenase